MTKDEAVLKESHEAAVKSLAALMDQEDRGVFDTGGCDGLFHIWLCP